VARASPGAFGGVQARLPISQALPLFEHFAAQGYSKRARGGWHHSAPW